MLIAPGLEVDEERLADICGRYGISELQIFGSQARGTAGTDSDIDILYTLRPGRRLGWKSSSLLTTSPNCSAVGSTWCHCAPCTRS